MDVQTLGRLDPLTWVAHTWQAPAPLSSEDDHGTLVSSVRVLPSTVCKAGSRAAPQEPEVPSSGPNSGSALPAPQCSARERTVSAQNHKVACLEAQVVMGQRFLLHD